MHDHDLDLIASLADGSLDDPAVARALVESCEHCSLEYETQLSIIAALATIEPVMMTDLEKAALHRDLWTELRNQPTKGSAGAPWWYRLSYAAAGVFVVVGLVAVVAQLGSFGGDSAGTVAEVSSDLDAGETMTPMDDGGQEEFNPTTTAAATGDAGAESAPDFKTLADETRREELPSSVRATSEQEQATCLTDAGLEDHELAGTVDNGRAYLIAVPDNVALDGETPVTFVNASTCQVVHVEE